MRSGAIVQRPPSRAVAPVISTILVVAVTVVLAAVLFVMVSSILAPPPPPPVAVILSGGQWIDGNNTADVLSATGVPNIAVGDLDFLVHDSTGKLMYTGAADQNIAVDSITVNVHYEDRDGSDRISSGDRVTVSVTPSSGSALLDGGVLEIYAASKQIVSHGI